MIDLPRADFVHRCVVDRLDAVLQGHFASVGNATARSERPLGAKPEWILGG
jgi:hypothetical protein